DAQTRLAGAAEAYKKPVNVLVALQGRLLDLVRGALPKMVATQIGKRKDFDQTSKSLEKLAGRLGDLVSKLEALNAAQKTSASLETKILELSQSQGEAIEKIAGKGGKLEVIEANLRRANELVNRLS